MMIPRLGAELAERVRARIVGSFSIAAMTAATVTLIEASSRSGPERAATVPASGVPVDERNRL
jgi:hypothetical protein